MASGLHVSDLRATVAPDSLALRTPQVSVEHVRLQLAEEALRRAIPPDARIAVDRLTAGRVWVSFQAGVFSGIAEIRPSVTPDGRLALDILGARAGFIPLGGGAVGMLLSMARDKFAGKPGLSVSPGARIVFDLGVLLRDKGFELPPLQQVEVGPGLVELLYAA